MFFFFTLVFEREVNIASHLPAIKLRITKISTGAKITAKKIETLLLNP